MKGFTLLEVMISLAIIAGVVVTVLGSVNFHMDILQGERDSTALTLKARQRLEELEQKNELKQKGSGTFAPENPELSWSTELYPTKVPTLQKLVMKVRHSNDKQEVVLVRYVLK